MAEKNPLVIASDESVLDEILRLAAAVGVTMERAADPAGAHAPWSRSPLVIIDEDSAAACARLPNRSGVLLVCRGEPDPRTWQHAFAVGVESVISLPDEEGSLVAAFAEVIEGPTAEYGKVVAVLGGRGGAGASVLAVGTGLAAARGGGNALLVDCDPLGGGVDLLLGAELDGGLRWPDLRVASGRVSMDALHTALPSRPNGSGELAFISCGRADTWPASDAVGAVIDAGRRSGRSVVCDVGRYVADCGRAAIDRADLVVLVVPAEFRACVAARCVVQRIGELAAPPKLVVRGPAPDGLCPEQVAEAVGLDLLDSMRPERGLDRALDRGEFELRRAGPLANTAHALLATLRKVDRSR